MKKQKIYFSAILIILLGGCIFNPRIGLSQNATTIISIKGEKTPTLKSIESSNNFSKEAINITSIGELSTFGWIFNDGIIYLPSVTPRNKWYTYFPITNSTKEAYALPSPFTKKDVDVISENNKYKVGNVIISPTGQKILFTKVIPLNPDETNPLSSSSKFRIEWLAYFRDTNKIILLASDLDFVCNYLVQQYSWSSDENFVLTKCEDVYGSYVTYLLIDLQAFKFVNIGNFTSSIFQHNMKYSQLIDAAISNDGEKISIYDHDTNTLAILKISEIWNKNPKVKTLQTININAYRGNISWSEDDQWIYFLNKKTHALDKVDIESFEKRTVLSIRDMELATKQTIGISEYRGYYDWRISEKKGEILVNFGEYGNDIKGLWLFSFQ